METYLTHKEIEFEFLREDLSNEVKAGFAVYLVKLAYQNGKVEYQNKLKKQLKQVFEEFESISLGFKPY